MTLPVRRPRWPVVAVAALAVAAVVLGYAVRSDGSGPGYRLVRAATGDVEQVLSVGGTVDAAHRADLAFAVGGTVARVEVAQGDRVEAGQVVAVLDTTSLRAAVVRAEATLAEAKAQLESDRSAQTQSMATGAQTQPETGSAGRPSGASPAVLAALKKQQADVLTAQSAAGRAIVAAKEALTAQVAACKGVAETDPETDPEADPETAPADAGAGDQALTACTTALGTVQAGQDDVAAAQDALAKALAALSGTLSTALGSVAKGSTGSSGSSGPEGAAARSGASSGTPSAAGAATQTVTAARLASDQASIDQAAAGLVEAKQALRRATLTATRSGRVASVGVTAGDDVSAGDAVAVVVGGRTVTVTGAVTATQVAQVAVGQTVRVTTPGSEQATTGTISAVGLVGDSSSGATTYPVTVMVEDPSIALPTGSRAMLAIVVGTATDVVTVPVSAVSRSGGEAVVRVEKDGILSTQRVTLGAVGATRAAITDGLQAGTTVVLADLGQGITDAGTTVGDRFGGPGGGRIGFGGPGTAGASGGPPGMTVSR